MAITITRGCDPINVAQLVVCIYSPPGLGKTTLGFTADSPLLLDFDGGAYRAAGRRDSVQVGQWSDVANIEASDVKDFDTVVVDTTGRALDALSVDIIARNPKMGRGGALTLPGYGELKARFIGWTKLLRSFGVDVVLLAHSDEQRNGDELIERLDMQGGSKNEVYKASDAMGRLSIVNGKRVLNFSPTDTAYGKNPGRLQPLAVPDMPAGGNFLGGVIRGIKASLNEASAEQQEESARVEAFMSSLNAMSTADAFNARMAEMASAKPKEKALLVSVAESKGIRFDRAQKSFVEAA